MPETFSTVLSLCIGYPALYAYSRNESAYSVEGQSAVRAVSEIVSLAENSQALFGAKASALSDLRKMADQHANDDWDGEGAIGIDAFTLWNSESFIRALPNDCPLPEIAPEPDGSISLDWIRSRHRMFSLSVGSSNRLAYAWLDGSDKGHGVALFNGVSVPSRILSDLQPIINYGTTPVWVA